jgi:hypothetical protein
LLKEKGDYIMWPNLKYSPNELLLGMVVNTKPTVPEDIVSEPTAEEVDIQMAYIDHQRFDGYAQTVDHAHRRKAAFDKQVLDRPPRETTFRAGDLVQVYRSDLDFTFKTDRKLLPKFSAPRRVVSRNKNSYQLETLEGLPIGGRFSSRRLRLFIPRKGTEVEAIQTTIEKEWCEREDADDRVDPKGSREEGNGTSGSEGGVEAEEVNHHGTHQQISVNVEESQITGVTCVPVAVRACNEDVA